MSGRTLLRFALVGWLAATLAAPLAAQTPPATAPMPREKPAIQMPTLGPLVFATDFAVPLNRAPGDHKQLLNISVGLFGGGAGPSWDDLPVAPMPREKGKPVVVEFEFGVELGSGPVLFGAEPITPPMTPPAPLSFEYAVPLNPDCQQVLQLAREMFGDCDHCRAAAAAPPAKLPHPLAGFANFRCDDNGSWWVEVARVPQPKVVAPGPQCLQVVEARQVVTMPATSCEKAGKLTGTWVRDTESLVVAATFAGDELRLCFCQRDEGTTVTLTVTAEYAVTKEGLVHGVVTGSDTEVKRDPKTKNAPPLANEFPDGALAEILHELTDAPFSFRVKHTSVGVMVSNLKFASTSGIRAQELGVLCGMYKPCRDGAIPAPKPKATQAALELPSGRYLEHKPQYFPPDPVVPLPRELAAQEDPEGAARRALAGVGAANSAPAPTMPTPVPPGCALPSCPAVTSPQAGWSPARPTNVPAGEFGMIADVFNQMLGTRPSCPAPVAVPRPAPCPATGVLTIEYSTIPPGSSYPQVVAPCAPCPVQPSAYVAPQQPAFSAVPPKPGIVGTWVREVGTMVYVVKIAPDHLTVSVTAAVEMEEGKVTTEGLVFTADYHLTRDGTTLVGLITGVDAILEGAVPAIPDLPRLAEDLEAVQKAMTDKPLALGVRVYGDTLVIGNVRMPEFEGGRATAFPLSSVGGRYRNAADKPLPKPKVTKMQPGDMPGIRLAPNRGGPACFPPGVCPVGGYGPPPFGDVPQIGPYPGLPYAFPPGFVPLPCLPPAYPTGASLPPLPPGVPNGAPGTLPPPSVGLPPLNDDLIPAQAPRLVPPAPAPMTPTIPPAVEDETPKPKKGKKKPKQTPDERMSKLLFQTDGQIRGEWRRFWFDPLTPERIHGGIR